MQLVSNSEAMNKSLNEVKKMSGDECIELRKAAGLNQRELAKLLGCSQPTICRWETGESAISALAAKLITIVTHQPAQRTA